MPVNTMNKQPRHFFSLHELLVMAALAALGGVSSSLVSIVGRVVHAAVGVPGGMQILAGLHVLWLILAVGLIRKPGAATATGILKGGVELLSGNPHGVLVLFYSALGGLSVDAVWLLLRRRTNAWTYMLAGGAGSASNVLIHKIVASLPGHGGVTAILVAMGVVAFASGAVLAGLLGYRLLETLHRAGVVGPQASNAIGPPSPPR